MQFVNNDMDDLFRRAAEEYPLKTDNGDWDTLLAKMKAAGDNDDGVGKKDGKTKNFFLLLLIPLVLICTTYIKNDQVDKKVSNKENAELKKLSSEKPSTQKKENFITTNKPGNIINPDVKRISVHPDAQKSYARQPNNFFSDTRLKNKKEQDSAKNSSENYQANNPQLIKVGVENKVGKDAIANLSATISETQEQNKKITSPLNKDENSFSKIENNKISTAPADKKDIVQETNESVILKNVNKENKVKKLRNKFYAGIVAGPDFSMVKSTNIKGTGYSFGLLAGYNFNKKLALETGVLWDHKSYQSEGKYFNAESLNWPHVTIIDLEGYCNMYEIPFNIRYNASSNTKSTWFANAGLSSYLMKKENYDYNYKRYGVYGKGNKEYKNSTKNWFAVAHLSIGLQKKLGSIGDLRIEPYLKMPLDGVGIGNLPLRSSGIYLGLTHPLR